MRTSLVCAPIALFLLAPVGVAQAPDIIITNTSSTGGTYKDSITMISASGVQRPLAQHPNNGAGGTGFVNSQPLHLKLGGVDYLYWFDGNIDAVYRGTDANGNGVIDPTEFEMLWDRGALASGSLSSDTMRHHNGQFILSNDFSNPNKGVFILEDMNADNDFYDPGEAVEIINGGGGSTGATVVVSGVTTSSDDIEAADVLSDGDVIWCCDDDKIWFRWDSTTMTNAVFLNYDKTFSAASGLLPANPDFGVGLPIPGSVSMTSEDLDLVSVDRLTNSVYLAVNFEDDEPWIYKCLDGNSDGDANDAGEVTLFWNGTLPVAGLTKPAIDDLFWSGGSLYFSVEEDPGGGASQGHVLQLTDLNGDGDALDPGEQATLHTLAVGDDPTVFGLSIVPAGTFGSGCVRFGIDDNGLSSTAPAQWFFTFEDIPAAALTGTEMGLVVISVTGDGPLSVGPPGRVIGLDVDFFTSLGLWFMPAFSTGPITTSTVTTPGVPPIQLPPGFTFFYAAGVFGPNAGPGGVWVSQSRSTTVQ